MSTPVPRIEVTPPAALPPFAYGLYSVADLADGTGGPWMQYGVEYPTLPCVDEPVHVWAAGVCPPKRGTPTKKNTYTIRVDLAAGVEGFLDVTATLTLTDQKGELGPEKFTGKLSPAATKPLPVGGPAVALGSVPDDAATVTVTVAYLDQVLPIVMTAPDVAAGKFKDATAVVDALGEIPTKSVTGPNTWVEADASTLYAQAACKFPDADLGDVARGLLDAGEENAVGKIVATRLAAVDDLLPDTATGVLAALAAVEESIIARTGRPAILLAPLLLAHVLASLSVLRLEDGRWVTPLGSPIAFLPALAGTDPKKLAVYATSQLMVKRSPVTGPAPVFDQDTNEWHALAERVVAVTTGPCLAAALVDVSALPGVGVA